MFLTLIKNYIKAVFALERRRTRRIRHEFELHGYLIYLDMFCSMPREHKNIDLIGYYNLILDLKDKEWNLKQYIDVMISCRDKEDLDGYKSIRDFMEYVVLSDPLTRKSSVIPGTLTYINMMVVKSLSDIRNDKLTKLLKDK